MEYTVNQLLEVVNKKSYKHPGNERMRAITEHIIEGIYGTIVKFDVSHDEIWAFHTFLNDLGKANQAGLLSAGIGVERLLDILMDEKDKKAGLLGKETPRAIEGPLFVPGAPLTKSFAVMNSEDDAGDPFVMEGKITDQDGNLVSGIILDAWMANSRGTYSIIDPTQAPYNNRRKIEVGSDGHYAIKGILPPGYAVPPNSPTQTVLDVLGREGNRPAHIHFMLVKPGYRHLTTQINLPGDKFLNEDFAFATRDELIVELKKCSDPEKMKKYGFTKPFTIIDFDFKVLKEK